VLRPGGSALTLAGREVPRMSVSDWLIGVTGFWFVSGAMPTGVSFGSISIRL
jgi:hypothetical protein